MELLWGAFIFVFIWILVLTIFYFQLSSHYNKLIKVSSGRGLQALIETLLKEIDGIKKDIAILKSRCDTIEKDGQLHIQKVGLLRFNPFKDTGGDQSFILALVDGNGTGVVLSGLYSRAGTRWYAKKVKNGQSVDHELSLEEKKALQEARELQ